jgi:hypothetical protein
MNSQALLDAVTSWNPDTFIVAGCYHMIPKLSGKFGPAYRLHASLLPDYSGCADLPPWFGQISMASVIPVSPCFKRATRWTPGQLKAKLKRPP